MPSDWTFVSVDMELTNKCSIECLMCPRDAISRPQGFMREDVFTAVSERLVNEGSLITFSGMGDPLLHPKVFEWISDIRCRGGDVGIVVNPASLNDNISQELIKSRLNSITISFPSVRKEIFERLCPNVSFGVALERVRDIISLAQEKIGLKVTGIITEINQGEHDEYVGFWKDMGIHSSMTVCHSRGGYLEVSDIHVPESVGPGSGKCGLFSFHTFITWEGDVLACCHDLTGTTRIGNLFNEEVFVIVNRKQKSMEAGMPFSICKQCDEP